jgi:Lamin Tail Domain
MRLLWYSHHSHNKAQGFSDNNHDMKLDFATNVAATNAATTAKHVPLSSSSHRHHCHRCVLGSNGKGLGTLALLLVLQMASFAVRFADAVVMTEIMLNPLNSAHGQWFELYNEANTVLLLNGWRLRATNNRNDRPVEYVTLFFDAADLIPPNGYMVIGKNNASGYVNKVWSDFPVYPADGSSNFAGDARIEVVDFFITEIVEWNIFSNNVNNHFISTVHLFYLPRTILLYIR